MQIDVTGQHVEITSSLKDYATEKVGKLEKHFDHVTKTHIVLRVEKNRQLARYLGDILQRAGEKGQLDSLGLSRESLQEIMTNIPNKETYLEAIAEASPIINSVVLTLQDRLEDLQHNFDVIVLVFDKRIESDFAYTRRNFIELKTLQSKTIETYTLLYQMLLGQHSNVDTLLQRDQSLKKFFPSDEILNVGKLETAELYLLERLKNIDNVIKQKSDDVAAYYAKQDELEDWRISVDGKIRIARNAISIWAQSHRNLGAGIPVPPLIDVAGIATGLVGTATGVVLP